MKHEVPKHASRKPRADAGFSYVEVLVAASLLAVSLLALCGMFVAAYRNVNGAGHNTMGLAATRQLFEEMRRLPFDNLINLDGVNTDDVTSLPAAAAELEVARRWRYALAGEGVGWSFTEEEKARWPSLAVQGDDLGAVGTISVAQVNADLVRISVTVSVPGNWRDIELSTLIARL